MKSNTVVITENAAFHTIIMLYKIFNLCSCKEVFQEWLIIHKIQFVDNLYNPHLCTLLEEHVYNLVKYTTVKILYELRFTVLGLPPNHPEFIPFEMI